MKNFPTRFFQPDKISEQSLLSLNQVRNSLDKDKVEQTLNSLDPKVAASTLESASSNWVSELLNAADKNGIEKVLKGLTAETRERIDDCLK